MRSLRKYLGDPGEDTDKMGRMTLTESDGEIWLDIKKPKKDLMFITLTLEKPYPGDEENKEVLFVGDKVFMSYIHHDKTNMGFNSCGPWIYKGMTHISHSENWTDKWFRDKDDPNNQKLPMMVTRCWLMFGIFGDDIRNDVFYAYHICTNEYSFSKTPPQEITCKDISRWQDVYMRRYKIHHAARGLLANMPHIASTIKKRKGNRVQIKMHSPI